MRTNLLKAVENVYNVFRKYHLDVNRLRNNSCPCCVNSENIQRIITKPLNILYVEDLRYFVKKAMTTFGTLDDYKHFLPRILELMLLHTSFDLVEDFLCYEKLNYAEWETWPEDEQIAIENYFSALWSHYISIEDVTILQILDILNIVVKYGQYEKCLREWSLVKNDLMVNFIIDGVLYGFSNIFNDNQKNAFENWVYSDEVVTKLENQFFETKDNELAKRISIVFTILENKYPITLN